MKTLLESYYGAIGLMEEVTLVVYQSMLRIIRYFHDKVACLALVFLVSGNLVNNRDIINVQNDSS